MVPETLPDLLRRMQTRATYGLPLSLSVPQVRQMNRIAAAADRVVGLAAALDRDPAHEPAFRAALASLTRALTDIPEPSLIEETADA